MCLFSTVVTKYTSKLLAVTQGPLTVLVHAATCCHMTELCRGRQKKYLGGPRCFQGQDADIDHLGSSNPKVLYMYKNQFRCILNLDLKVAQGHYQLVLGMYCTANSVFTVFAHDWRHKNLFPWDLRVQVGLYSSNISERYFGLWLLCEKLTEALWNPWLTCSWCNALSCSRYCGGSRQNVSQLSFWDESTLHPAGDEGMNQFLWLSLGLETSDSCYF